MNTLQKYYESKTYDFKHVNLEIYYKGIENMTVLDVGCGTGKLSGSLTRRGNVCYGITISESEAEQAKKRMHRVFVMDIEQISELPLEKGFFDSIICADILEHLRDPRKTLLTLRPYLKDSGTIYCSIPNIANAEIRFKLLMGCFDYHPFGILDDTHVRFFTRKTAAELVKNSGFKIIRVQSTHPTWKWFNAIRKKLPYDWELTERLVNLWPSFFATQFVISANKELAFCS